MNVCNDRVPAETYAAPASEAPAAAAAAAPASGAAKFADRPKMFEMPKPVEATMRVVETMTAAEAATDAPLEPTAAAAADEAVSEARPSRFAMLAASVAFAGALGAMAGALGTTIFAPPQAVADTSVAAVDLASLHDSITGLRKELSAIKSSVESSNRNASAQFAKFTERLERMDRAPAAPAAQHKLAMQAVERLEKRASGDVTGSVRTQTASAERPRQRVIGGWVVRHVSRGVAVIQGRRNPAFEVETGDIVPGVGRIESIRRQDGRWVVLTSNGMITSPTPR